ncbi:hypothetical protein PHO31112_04027 [Pandoraea horticolens]|uniref:Uncharacterized protein n=1 Tax=Pandoraea horticolens TaxID=2508298 RepID=A0A5E4XQG7_9BURK|nr:hypothetical protein PHO31112_04027 [Pandoraea horticolens]
MLPHVDDNALTIHEAPFGPIDHVHTDHGFLNGGGVPSGENGPIGFSMARVSGLCQTGDVPCNCNHNPSVM